MGIFEVKVFNDTKEQIRNKYNPFEGEYKAESKCYFGDLKCEPLKPKTPITMVQGGTVSTGYKYAKEGNVVAILNFADALTAGGLVEYGETTQEENICRCSNLYPVLCSPTNKGAYYNPNREFNIGGNIGVYLNHIIYLKDATVFKDDKTYENIEPVRLDIITSPAPSRRLPDIRAYQIYVSRIEQIVFSAIENGVGTIILGAWGCGAFHQNPILIARAFAEVLNKYGGHFKDIVFAMRESPNHNDGANMYNIFESVFKSEYKGGVA